jgi:hypothetical protein
MVFTERALRDLLNSRYGRSCGETILEGIDAGRAYTIHMEDGCTMILRDRTTAAVLLRERFDWQMAGEAAWAFPHP